MPAYGLCDLTDLDPADVQLIRAALNNYRRAVPTRRLARLAMRCRRLATDTPDVAPGLWPGSEDLPIALFRLEDEEGLQNDPDERGYLVAWHGHATGTDIGRVIPEGPDAYGVWADDRRLGTAARLDIGLIVLIHHHVTHAWYAPLSEEDYRPEAATRAPGP